MLLVHELSGRVVVVENSWMAADFKIRDLSAILTLRRIKLNGPLNWFSFKGHFGDFLNLTNIDRKRRLCASMTCTMKSNCVWKASSASASRRVHGLLSMVTVRCSSRDFCFKFNPQINFSLNSALWEPDITGDAVVELAVGARCCTAAVAAIPRLLDKQKTGFKIP